MFYVLKILLSFTLCLRWLQASLKYVAKARKISNSTILFPLYSLSKCKKNKLIFCNGWFAEVNNLQKSILNCFGDFLDLEIVQRHNKMEKWKEKFLVDRLTQKYSEFYSQEIISSLFTLLYYVNWKDLVTFT